MRIYLIIISLFLTLGSCKEATTALEYPKEEGTITWIDITTAESISNREEKYFFIDMYTDWCGWCKVMDRKTFTDPTVIEYMDKNFHNIKFDAEQREEIVFNAKNYIWSPRGRNGVNGLAQEMLQGRLSYPSYVILDKNKNTIHVARGYMPPEKFMNEMKNILN